MFNEESFDLFRKLFISILISVLIILLDTVGVFTPIYSFSGKVFNPINGAISSSFRLARDVFSTIPQLSVYKKENEDLKLQIDDLKSENTRLFAELEKREYIEEQDQFMSNLSGYRLLPVRIVNIERTTLETYIYINAGANEGIVANQNVVYKQYLIGKVDEVFEESSRIIAIGSSKNNVPVITEKSKIEGLVTSDLEHGLLISNILPGEELEEGETVLSSSSGGLYKYGLIAGKVGKVISTESDLVHEYKLESDVVFDDLLYISVIFSD